MEGLGGVIFCGNPDLNYIDGSSIWAQTFALALAASGVDRVRFIAKSPPARKELFAPLDASDVIEVLDGTAPEWWGGGSRARLNHHEMAELAVALDAQERCQVLVVRGLEIARALTAHPGLLARTWLYLTDIPQRLEEYTPELRQLMHALGRGCGLLLCQTEGFAALWKRLVPGLDDSRIRIYSPVIPDIPVVLPELSARPRRAIYAGKFKAEWMTLQMAREWRQVRRQLPDAELVMIGDKIHKEAAQPKFHDDMRDALAHTPGLRWLGALSHEAVQAELQQARVGLSWRAPSMDDTVEYSTKILEYGGAGCAAILNRNPLHESLLGSDYPLFANTSAEFRDQLVLALRDDKVLRKAAHKLRAVAERHTFSARVGDIRQWFASSQPRRAAPPAVAKPRPDAKVVLVAGHDLKFFRPLQAALEATGRYTFLVDQWKGHAKHDEQQSLSLLAQADVIFCEWCLGNLEWYSRHKLPGQRLVARFHAQERFTPYLGRSVHEAIDHVVYVSEPMREIALATCAFPRGKTSVIGNLIDEARFKPAKKFGDARFTLGMIGIVPSLKRLDRAVDLLELLLREDKRYVLRIKGALPQHHQWLLNRQDEMEYYRRIFSRINGSDTLRTKVIFDPPGHDVEKWLAFVGYILSPSDAEAFHVAVGEGMATGCVPVVWNWPGAERVWPEQSVVSSTSDAAVLVRSPAVSGGQREYVLSHYSAEAIVPLWANVIDQSVT